MGKNIDIVRANFKARQNIMGELRQIDEACTTDQRTYTEDESAKITELRSQLESIDGRISSNLEVEARSAEIENGMERFLGVLADRESGSTFDTRSLGERFTSDEFRSWAESGARGVSPAMEASMDFRAVTDTDSTATSGGAWINNQRLSRTGKDFLDRRTFLIDLLPHIAVSSGSVEYVQDASPQADMSDKAAETAEGAAKPQAGITTSLVTEATATIAAWANITRQVAADAPQVQGYLNNRLRYSVKRRADGQAINGDGAGANLTGLLNRSGINSYTAPGTSEDAAQSIRKALTLLEEDEAVGEIIVVNPADAENFDLTNYATDGLHAVPNVAGPSARTSWGLTQVRSTAIASGTALIIDPMAVAVLDRQQVSAYMTDSHASNFTSNMLTLLLEARIGLALFDPKGVCEVTFDYTP